MKLKQSVLYVCLVSLAFWMGACGNDNESDSSLVTDTPGEISGLGKNRGELTGTTFELPAGIGLKGTITGYPPSGDYTRSTKAGNEDMELSDEEEAAYALTMLLLRGGREYDVALGNGYAVPIYFVLENTTEKEIEVTFPAGLIVKSHAWESQYGLLVKKTSLTVSAQKEVRVLLFMHCCHLDIPAPNITNALEWGVITNSSLLVEVCQLLEDKQINYEEFGAFTKTYFHRAYYIQERIWDLTDRGTALTDAHKEWLNNIPKSD